MFDLTARDPAGSSEMREQSDRKLVFSLKLNYYKVNTDVNSACLLQAGLEKGVGMAHYKLISIPLIAQSTNMSCWFAAGQMVRNVFTCGPLAGMLATNAVDFAEGLAPERFENFRQENGFDSLIQSEGDIVAAAGDAHHQDGFTAENIIYFLERYGPIWSALNWGENFHVIVVIGVARTGGENWVLYHDPVDGKEEKMLLGRRTKPASFNGKCLYDDHPSNMLHFPRANGRRAPMMSALSVQNGF